jgi:FtsP/CotA-like multicopper oxidase with cupredoxin domain
MDIRPKLDARSAGTLAIQQLPFSAEGEKNYVMARRGSVLFLFAVVLVIVAALPANAQSFRVQCPTSTITHPNAAANNSEPAYTGPTYTGSNGYPSAPAHVNGAIKCQQISGGDGYATMGDGTQTYMFSFGPLSGLVDIANGQPGSEFPSVFNTPFPAVGGSAPNMLLPGDPATTVDGGFMFTFNGAVGLTGDQEVLIPGAGGGATAVATITGGIVTDVTVTSGGSGYVGAPSVTFSPAPPTGITAQGVAFVANGVVTSIDVTFTGSGYTSPPTITFGPASNACVGTSPPPQCLTGHVDPRQIEDIGVMNGNIPAPLMAMDEDDEFFLTLTNVGMIMRPDLFEQHTVHFHGYPNASSFYDGVPDASVAINIGGSFTYYYLAPDAGTYFWHCHITPPEHLQMGMVGQLYVRPRQNRVPVGGNLLLALHQQQLDLRTKCDSSTDILCSNPLPRSPSAGLVTRAATGNYAYNDGDGSTYYDVEFPLQIHGFDPNFHFVGMTFNPEGFTDMKDKYFLLNGRSYPDTVTLGSLETQSADGVNHFSQPLSARIDVTAGQRALLRISDLDVTEYQTLASLGIPMKVIGYNAKLLRDQAGNNLYYNTNSITLGGGESLDVILDACLVRASNGSCTTPFPTGTYYLYTTNLDHLSNDAENFGGLMTEVHVN